MPKISILVPVYNSQQTIIRLVNSIIATKSKGWQLIIVDDASTDKTLQVLHQFISELPQKISNRIKIIKNKSNHGAAITRNRAFSSSRGELIIFFDGDVWFNTDLIQTISDYFNSHPQVQAASGFPGTTQENPYWFPRYKYWRDWSYWNLERSGNKKTRSLEKFSSKDSKTQNRPSVIKQQSVSVSQTLSFWRPAVGAIRRTVFTRLKGFDPRFKGAGVEDLEFSYRLNQITQVHYIPDWIVCHSFAGFRRSVRKYFSRAFEFLPIARQYKHLASAAASPNEAYSIIAADLFGASLTVFSLFVFGGKLPSSSLIFSIFALLAYIYLQRKFLFLILKKESWLFFLYSLAVSLFLHWLISVAAVLAFVRSSKASQAH